MRDSTSGLGRWGCGTEAPSSKYNTKSHKVQEDDHRKHRAHAGPLSHPFSGNTEDRTQDLMHANPTKLYRSPLLIFMWRQGFPNLSKLPLNL